MSHLNISSSLQTRSDAEPVDPSLVQLFVSESTTSQYFIVALATLLVYHSIITLDKEVHLTGMTTCKSNPRSSVSIIYFANHYIGLLAAACNITFALFTESLARYFVSRVTLRASIVLMQTPDLAITVLIDYILLIRVLALYHQDRKLSITLKILLGLDAGLNLGILIYGTVFEDLYIGSLAEG
ncbi:hypothetical protein A7U60_g8002 [Sanghuangporus baumii]|uniref:DUF6533 domain-containing protein n=1 Tax=Sanghuangporus baumii TaxID=108892 RepID=A0A9Q5HS92_SANBA|nr:hypothetical protein A7U60_g8002 [Sanghuangporus baumii]